MARERFGLSCAISTPFDAAGVIDVPLLVRHAQACVSEGCGSITVFGTTGEGFSIGPAERARVYAAFKSAGFDLRRQIGAGVMASSVEEAAAQARQALDLGCRHILLAPPFYFKGISDDGLFAWHAALFNELGEACRDIVLYNLPGQTAVMISHDLVTRLRQAFPKVIIGVKDSSGDWPYTERMLALHRDIAILIGDERHLARAVRMGGEGSICGLANTHAGLLAPVVATGAESAAISALVDVIVSCPVLPAVKALVAEKRQNATWLAVRPPLVRLDDAQRKDLLARCKRIAGA